MPPNNLILVISLKYNGKAKYGISKGLFVGVRVLAQQNRPFGSWKVARSGKITPECL